MVGKNFNRYVAINCSDLVGIATCCTSPRWLKESLGVGLLSFLVYFFGTFGAEWSQASVQGAQLTVAYVERSFFFSVFPAQKAQWQYTKCHPVSLSSATASPRAARLSPVPLIDQPVCFSFLWRGNAYWDTFDSALSRPPGALLGTVDPEGFMGKCWLGEMVLFTRRWSLWGWLSSMSTFQKMLSKEQCL